MRTTVYTRHTYELADPRFRARAHLALQTSVPAVLEAAVKAIDKTIRWVWWVRAGEAEEELRRILEPEAWPPEVELVTLRGDQWLEDDHVQVALDSDDRIAPAFLRHVQEFARPGPPYLLTWQPVKEELATGRLFRMARKYSDSTPSMFYAVFNPTREVCVYRRTHTRMAELAPCMLVGVEGGPRVTAVIHDGNHLMAIRPDEKEIRT